MENQETTNSNQHNVINYFITKKGFKVYYSEETMNRFRREEQRREYKKQQFIDWKKIWDKIQIQKTKLQEIEIKIEKKKEEFQLELEGLEACLYGEEYPPGEYQGFDKKTYGLVDYLNDLNFWGPHHRLEFYHYTQKQIELHQKKETERCSKILERDELEIKSVKEKMRSIELEEEREEILSELRDLQYEEQNFPQRKLITIWIGDWNAHDGQMEGLDRPEWADGCLPRDFWSEEIKS